MGLAAVRALATHNPQRIFLAARNSERGAKAIADIQKDVPGARLTFVKCDLSSLASVQSAARSIIAQSSDEACSNSRLDILICNGGLAAAPPALSVDGFEVQFATNHLGHALLIKLLLPTILRTATAQSYQDADNTTAVGPRIVFVSSDSYVLYPSGGIAFSSIHTPQNWFFLGPLRRYAQSKLANILYAAELARRYRDQALTSLSVHPGISYTDILAGMTTASRILIRMGTVGMSVSTEEAARSVLWAATADKGNIVSGGYYEPVGVRKSVKVDKDEGEELAGRLWTWTEKTLRELGY